MKKTRKSVPPATENMPIEQPEAAPTTAAAPAQETMPVLIEIPQIDPEMAALAKKWGIPLDKIVQMGERINVFFADYTEFKKLAVDAFKEVGANIGKLEPLIKLSEQISQQQPAQTPTADVPQGNWVAALLQAAPQIVPYLFGGGGSNPLQEKSEKLMGILLDRAMDNVMKPSAGATFEKVFEEEMIKAKAKAAAQVLTQQ